MDAAAKQVTITIVQIEKQKLGCILRSPAPSVPARNIRRFCFVVFFEESVMVEVQSKIEESKR